MTPSDDSLFPVESDEYLRDRKNPMVRWSPVKIPDTWNGYFGRTFQKRSNV